MDKRQRTWLWVTLATVFSVVAAGVLTAAVYVGRTVAPIVESMVAAQRTELVAPETLSGKPRLTGARVEQGLAELKAGMGKEIKGETSTLAAAYGDEQGIVLVVGGSAPILDPAKELNAFEYAQKPGAVGRSTFNPIDAGPLGGLARCGWIGLSETPMNVCVWADSGSKGAVYWADADARGHSVSEFHAIREQVQKR